MCYFVKLADNIDLSAYKEVRDLCEIRCDHQWLILVTLADRLERHIAGLRHEVRRIERLRALRSARHMPELRDVQSRLAARSAVESALLQRVNAERESLLGLVKS